MKQDYYSRGDIQAGRVHFGNSQEGQPSSVTRNTFDLGDCGALTIKPWDFKRGYTIDNVEFTMECRMPPPQPLPEPPVTWPTTVGMAVLAFALIAQIVANFKVTRERETARANVANANAALAKMGGECGELREDLEAAQADNQSLQARLAAQPAGA